MPPALKPTFISYVQLLILQAGIVCRFLDFFKFLTKIDFSFRDGSMNNDTDSLNKKKVLITGGGSGMGRAIALSMAEEGASVGICGRRKDALLETINLHETGSKPKEFIADVTDRSSVGKLFDWFDEEFGSLDIMVHAAGLNIANRSMQELEHEDWDQLIETNLTGSFNILSPALKRMREKQKGLIILINSVAGRRATPLAGIAYNCSKFGMTALGLGVGEEEKENGIRITNIYPGEVNTEILNQRKQPPNEMHRASILQPADISSIVVSLSKLPDHVHVPELVVKPTLQSFV